MSYKMQGVLWNRVSAYPRMQVSSESGKGKDRLVEVIENPVLNSPYKEPTRHFRFSDEGVTSEIMETIRETPVNP